MEVSVIIVESAGSVKSRVPMVTRAIVRKPQVTIRQSTKNFIVLKRFDFLFSHRCLFHAKRNIIKYRIASTNELRPRRVKIILRNYLFRKTRRRTAREIPLPGMGSATDVAPCMDGRYRYRYLYRRIPLGCKARQGFIVAIDLLWEPRGFMGCHLYIR